MATPASVYVPSEREYPARLPEMEYPDGYERRRVYEHGDIHWSNQAIFPVRCWRARRCCGLRRYRLEQDEQGWRIWFGPVLLARLDREHLLLPRSRGRVRVSVWSATPLALRARCPRDGVGGGGRERALPWRNIEKCYPCAWVILLPMSQDVGHRNHSS